MVECQSLYPMGVYFAYKTGLLCPQSIIHGGKHRNRTGSRMARNCFRGSVIATIATFQELCGLRIVVESNYEPAGPHALPTRLSKPSTVRSKMELRTRIERASALYKSAVLPIKLSQRMEPRGRIERPLTRYECVVLPLNYRGVRRLRESNTLNCRFAASGLPTWRSRHSVLVRSLRLERRSSSLRAIHSAIELRTRKLLRVMASIHPL
jgi:hypothetical protein